MEEEQKEPEKRESAGETQEKVFTKSALAGEGRGIFLKFAPMFPISARNVQNIRTKCSESSHHTDNDVLKFKRLWITIINI